MTKVDLIVPCYNESESLNAFYEETQRVFSLMPLYSFSYVFIDDGSSDNTLAIIKELADKDKSVKYISFSRNFGKEAAMYAGMKNSSGELVGIIDADLQHPPEMLVEMIKEIENGYDVCSARRVSRDGEPRIRSFFSRQFYKLINKMSEIDLVDGAVDYRVMTRQVIDAILQLSEVQRFSKGIFTWVGFETKWLEFKNIERMAGESKWSFWKLFKYALDGITSFTTAPLRIASFLGIIISFFAFIYLLIEFFKRIFLGTDVPGYSTTVILILFMGGIILLSCGILGEYIARLYAETKNRPIYIEKHSNLQKDKKTENNKDGKDKE